MGKCRDFGGKYRDFGKMPGYGGWLGRDGGVWSQNSGENVGILGKCWDFGMQGRETDAGGEVLGENNGILGKCRDLEAAWVRMGMFGTRIWGKMLGF